MTELADCWRGERLSIPSKLSPEVAAAWIGVTPLGFVRRTAPEPTARSTWQPALTGYLVPDGDGCRFEGTIRCVEWIRLFWAFWLGGATLFTILSALIATLGADPHFALAAVVIPLFSLLMLATILITRRRRQAQIDSLRSWITGALTMPISR